MPPKKATKRAKKPSSRAAAKKEPATFYRTCSRCGRTEACPEGGLPPGWSMGMEGRRTEYLDPGCARANIRAIEGRLTEEYWEF
ncbi:MAG TPA: hypothetical protein VJ922_08640 [Actinomycetota bacterium]|nr:hypothetical protein [Actinomycetota bacterium]